MIRIRTILVPTDFGDSAKCAWEYAQVLAQQFNSRVHLVHVLTPPALAADPLGARQLGMGVAELLRECEEDCRKALDKIPVPRQLERRVVRKLLNGPPVAQILDYVDAHDIDLVVMGTHGRGPVQHVLLGSVAERVVRHCPVPVLTVHTTGRVLRDRLRTPRRK
jgi:nucleotide-binding universal stress UspA family protein